ncbi:MAG TPA: PBP1A family penicillin-binding protein [bacterium]|nr:PBP1A family penicillin-binding protein [bacterium]
MIRNNSNQWKNRPLNKSKTSKLNVKLRNTIYYNKKWLKKQKPKNTKLFWSRFVVALIILFLISTIFMFGAFAWYSRDLPDPNKIIDRSVIQSTKIYDKTGEHLLYDLHGTQQRTLIEINTLPDYVINATISIEDKNFYKHKGISILSIIRAQIVPRLQGKRAQGGSTLTQQFVKNAILTNERSLGRKIKEWILSYKIEQKYSKQEILKMYFNEIPYGSVAYGIESASNIYFDKSAKDLTIAESAILAALPQAPSYYSPYGPHRDILFDRQKYILKLMKDQGYINEDQYNNALNEKVTFKQKKDNIQAPHFVFYVKDLLSQMLGERVVEEEGLKVITTIDYDLQKKAQEIIEEKTADYPKKYGANNAALISIDIKNGDILTMVGSRDFFNDEIDGQVNVVTSSRQPGSSIKPIIYSQAFEKGYQPETIVFDVPTIFKTDLTDYEPKNYDLQTHGPVSLRKALAGSLNIPAVKVLYLVGISDALNALKNFGYSTIRQEKDYGLSLTLGGLEVKMIEHLNAFAVFARDGVKKQNRAILKIEDAKGKTIYEAKNTSGERVLSEESARKVNNILSDNSARSFIFGEKNYLTMGGTPIAAKTGTTNDFNDAWTVGYTTNVATAVWVGNNNNKKMSAGADGSVVAAPIWNAFMQQAISKYGANSFNDYQRIEINKPMIGGSIAEQKTLKINKLSGLLATENTPSDLVEEKTFKKVHSILHYIIKSDPLGSYPDDPNQDPNYEVWENAVQKWATENGFDQSDPPTQYDETNYTNNEKEEDNINNIDQ